MIGKTKRMRKELDWYEKRFTFKQGGSSINGEMIDYHMVSLNAGLDWYLIDEKYKIIGEVNKIYPKLLEHLDKVKALCNGEFDKVGTINF